MSSKTKSEIKAFFQTADKPTEAQFVDFIDSYVDKSGPIGTLETACSAGPSGPVVVTNGTPSVTTYPALKASLNITTLTTADVVAQFPYATTAQANAGTAQNVVMDPVLVKNAIMTLAGSGVISVKRQIFTGSGTYTPSAGLLYADVEVIGSGAGGGGTVAATSSATGAGGGGAGGYSRSLIAAATIGASQAVTIGAAGAGGAATGADGSSGGDSSLGTLVVAKGGVGGTGCTAAGDKGKPGGAGGAAASGTGDLKAGGGSGSGGFGASIQTTNALGGAGGNSFFGGGGKQVSAVTSGGTAGSAGTAYGAGGSGGASVSSGAVAGGDGLAGAVIITEYCSQ